MAEDVCTLPGEEVPSITKAQWLPFQRLQLLLAAHGLTSLCALSSGGFVVKVNCCLRIYLDIIITAPAYNLNCEEGIGS